MIEPHRPEQRAPDTAGTAMTWTEIRAIARERARGLQGVPRDELARRFTEVSEKIRTQAIAAGTAIEGDWQAD